MKPASRSLTLVESVQAVETIGQAAMRLEAEAATRARQAAAMLLEDLTNASTNCAEVAGFKALPYGVRDELERLGAHIAAVLVRVNAVTSRVG